MLIAAIGGLTPSVRKPPGFERVAAERWHYGAWRDLYDFTKNRVAVVGRADSAAQVVPEIARGTSEFHALQRTPADAVAPAVDPVK